MKRCENKPFTKSKYKIDFAGLKIQIPASFNPLEKFFVERERTNRTILVLSLTFIALAGLIFIFVPEDRKNESFWIGGVFIFISLSLLFSLVILKRRSKTYRKKIVSDIIKDFDDLRN